MAAHSVSVKTYVAVFVALLALTALTVGVAFSDLGGWGTPMAVAIACVKATLVVLFFMHVRYESRLIGMYAASGFVFLLILFLITMGEVAGRGPAASDQLGPVTPAASSFPPVTRLPTPPLP